MAAYTWLGPFRHRVRSTFYTVLQRALQTDDGRRILGDSLIGITSPGATAPPLAPNPYSGLRPIGASRSRAPVFITARFRTGSTLLWQMCRAIPGCTSYYEPLNERRWFDVECRGTRVDQSHGVDDYWREYDGLQHLGEWYRQEWGSRRLYMDRSAIDPGLYAYIRTLIETARGRAILQFNRVDFRLEWLRQNFPDATVVHLYRHPREQWCSTLMGDPFPRTGSVDAFERVDRFYLLAWARDLSCRFPFLDPRHAGHPYELFYLIWRLSYLFGQEHADVSLSYEALCASPQAELRRMLAVAEIGVADERMQTCTRLVTSSRLRWTEYADGGWFDEIEARCEDVLRRAIGRPAVRPFQSSTDRVEVVA